MAAVLSVFAFVAAWLALGVYVIAPLSGYAFWSAIIWGLSGAAGVIVIGEMSDR